MTARSKKNIASLIFSILLVLSGITICILINELVKTAVRVAEQSSESSFSSNINPSAFTYGGAVSLLGLGFILPGVTGLIAFFTRRKCGYIVHLVFGIKALVVMAIFFVVGLFVLIGLSASHSKMDCIDGPTGCLCKNTMESNYMDIDRTYQNTNVKKCSSLYALYDMCVSIVAILTLAWILLLVETVFAGVEACSREDNQTGGVIIRAPAQTGFVRLNEAVGPPAYAVQDRTVLVIN